MFLKFSEPTHFFLQVVVDSDSNVRVASSVDSELSIPIHSPEADADTTYGSPDLFYSGKRQQT